jgi:hypothetical protein
MTEPEQPHPLIFPLAADVAGWFAATGAKAVCPFCETQQWIIIAEGDTVALVQDGIQKDQSTDKAHLPLLTLKCAKCSFIRQHHFQDFLDWQAQHVGSDKK